MSEISTVCEAVVYCLKYSIYYSMIITFGTKGDGDFLEDCCRLFKYKEMSCAVKHVIKVWNLN
jgi:hypothetical protein